MKDKKCLGTISVVDKNPKISMKIHDIKSHKPDIPSPYIVSQYTNKAPTFLWNPALASSSLRGPKQYTTETLVIVGHIHQI